MTEEQKKAYMKHTYNKTTSRIGDDQGNTRRNQEAHCYIQASASRIDWEHDPWYTPPSPEEETLTEYEKWKLKRKRGKDAYQKKQI